MPLSSPLAVSSQNFSLRYPQKVSHRCHHLHLLTVGFVVVLMISNLVGPRTCQIGWLRPGAAEFLFPLTYICGDLFTESTAMAPCTALSGAVLRHGSTGRHGPAGLGLATTPLNSRARKPMRPSSTWHRDLLRPALSATGLASLPTAKPWRASNCSLEAASCGRTRWGLLSRAQRSIPSSSLWLPSREPSPRP